MLSLTHCTFLTLRTSRSYCNGAIVAAQAPAAIGPGFWKRTTASWIEQKPRTPVVFNVTALAVAL
jgi:hypothetical protein